MFKVHDNSRIFVIISIQMCLNVNAENVTVKKNPLVNKYSTVESSESYLCEEKISSPWCIPPNLNTGREPWKYRHQTNLSLPWNYQYTFDILDVEEVNDKAQTITIVMYFRIKWMEPRLKIEKSHSDWNNARWEDGGLSCSSEILNHIWSPDLEVDGIKEFKSVKLLKHMSNVLVYQNNHIQYGVRAEITISCQMNFSRFPLDYQRCPFRVASYLSTENIVNCTSKFTHNTRRQRKLQYSISISPLPQEHRHLGDFGNKFTTCGFYIHLERHLEQIFCQVYLTSILFVIVSWTSFLIFPEIVPGRMGLLVTIFLVLINIFNEAKSTAPVSENLNSLDLYLLFCICQVFLALAEYAILLSTHKMKTSSIVPTSNAWKDEILLNNNSCRTLCSLKNKLDTISLAIFPLIFIFFDIVYLAIYF